MSSEGERVFAVPRFVLPLPGSPRLLAIPTRFLRASACIRRTWGRVSRRAPEQRMIPPSSRALKNEAAIVKTESAGSFPPAASLP